MSSSSDKTVEKKDKESKKSKKFAHRQPKILSDPALTSTCFSGVMKLMCVNPLNHPSVTRLFPLTRIKCVCWSNLANISYYSNGNLFAKLQANLQFALCTSVISIFRRKTVSNRKAIYPTASVAYVAHWARNGQYPDIVSKSFFFIILLHEICCC